ncbi:MAG: EAL domain-containing protein [Alphaproteobacteria bacterium]
MSPLFHAAIAFGAIVPAGFAAFGVPALFADADKGLARIAGALVLLAGAVVHEFLARRSERRALVRELEGHRTQQSKVLGELARSRAELHQLHDALEAALHKRTSGAAREFEQVISEVGVLRRLVDEIVAAPVSLAFQSPPAPQGHANSKTNGHANGHDGKARIEGPVAEDLGDEDILEAVREGIAADRVDLFLQPIVSLPQRRRRYFECYSRIRTAYGATLLPGRYLGIAERAGLIAAIDNLLLLRCVQLVRKSQQRRFDVGFFIHISPRTLGDAKFLGEFVDFMLENRDLSRHLFFEFAEADARVRDDRVAAALARLGRAGFRFSIDQVSGADCDARALKAMHVGFIKIDAATALGGGALANFADFKAALDLAGIEVIVEKIESEPVLLELLDHHIDFGQGFLFGEPRLSRDT